ncbi:MAG: hypothetical protein FJ167_04010 [Gammaproteobacteria bacterium]|nr:hypothetical protein [Gammaproteobacteria bacterium]
MATKPYQAQAVVSSSSGRSGRAGPSLASDRIVGEARRQPGGRGAFPSGRSSVGRTWASPKDLAGSGCGVHRRELLGAGPSGMDVRVGERFALHALPVAARDSVRS